MKKVVGKRDNRVRTRVRTSVQNRWLIAKHVLIWGIILLKTISLLQIIIIIIIVIGFIIMIVIAIIIIIGLVLIEVKEVYRGWSPH